MTATERDGRIRHTIDHIRRRWAESDTELLREVFPLLAVGRPVPIAEIAEKTGSTTTAVEAALITSRAGRDADGRVTELFGLMFNPTLHRVEVERVCLFACCAAIAQMVPALIGERATIESVDPVSRRLVRLTIGTAGDLRCDPPEAVDCFVETKLDDVMGNVSAAFCAHVHHFVSRQSARSFVKADARRYTLEMQEFHTVSVRLHDRIWGVQKGRR